MLCFTSNGFWYTPDSGSPAVFVPLSAVRAAPVVTVLVPDGPVLSGPLVASAPSVVGVGPLAPSAGPVPSPRGPVVDVLVPEIISVSEES